MAVYFLLILFATLCIGGLMVLYTFLMKKTRAKNMTLQNHVDLQELFVTLEFIIKIESDLYESYLENNSNTDLTSITNTEFINIYNDLSMRCLKAVSDQFWELIEVYMSREAAQTYITQRVYSYLADKVKE